MLQLAPPLTNNTSYEGGFKQLYAACKTEWYLSTPSSNSADKRVWKYIEAFPARR